MLKTHYALQMSQRASGSMRILRWRRFNAYFRRDDEYYDRRYYCMTACLDIYPRHCSRVQSTDLHSILGRQIHNPTVLDATPFNTPSAPRRHAHSRVCARYFLHFDMTSRSLNSFHTKTIIVLLSRISQRVRIRTRSYARLLFFTVSMNRAGHARNLFSFERCYASVRPFGLTATGSF
jgi:hypothetical protein